jgi:hypothetical protein
VGLVTHNHVGEKKKKKNSFAILTKKKKKKKLKLKQEIFGIPIFAKI